MREGAVNSSSGMERGGGKSAQVSSMWRVGGMYHERWGCMDRGRGRMGGGQNTGGGCQGWLSRAVVVAAVAAVAAACTGQRQPVIVAGDM